MVDYKMEATKAISHLKNHSRSIAGFKAAVQILENWGCNAQQAINILQIKKSSFYRYKSNVNSARLNNDQLTRVSYLLNIHQALKVIFSNPENINSFMSLPNHNAYFAGAKPLDIISGGNFADLHDVAMRIDALRIGRWS